MKSDKSIWTIGHSNHEIGHFVGLLQTEDITLLVDVRSQPYSKFSPQFNREPLKQALGPAIEYEYMHDLGGRPEEPKMYDPAGHVLYGEVARSMPFVDAISRLTSKATTTPVAIMCGEEDPTECHRRLLVGRVLMQTGWQVTHIRGDGRFMSEDLVADVSGPVETGLFEGGEFSTWRSIRSVSPRSWPENSSTF